MSSSSFKPLQFTGLARISKLSAPIRGKPGLIYPITAITRDVGDHGDLLT
jgi:hypothetical protein